MRSVLGALGLVIGLSMAPAYAASTVPASPTPSVSPVPSASPSPWLASPSPEATPFTPGAGGGPDVPIVPYLIQLLVVTGVVAGLGYLTLQYVQKKMPGLAIGTVTGKQIRLVEKLTVDPKRMVFMVNVGERYWLCAATESHVTTIAELTKDDLGGQFARLLEQEKHHGETP